MRILHVLDHSLPLHSGYTFRTRAIVTAQKTMGLDVACLTGARHRRDGPDPETIEGIEFYRTPVPPGGPTPLREWREIKALASRLDSLAEEWRPDLLHVHSPVLNAMAALQVAKKRSLPLIYEIRAFWEDAAVGNGTGTEGSPRYRLTKALETRAVRKADAVAVICDGLRTDLIDRGIHADKIFLTPNGVDMGLFGSPLPPDPAFAERLGLTGADVVGFIGSFYDYEGIDDLIAAFPLLLRHRPNAHLLLVGGGPMEAQLKAQAAALAVKDHIHFIGRVPHEEVELYYSLIDILAYPRKAMRLTELVTPLKPLEAMAQRKLVAASNVGGHRELIEDGVTGILFPPGDPEALAAALDLMFANRGQWEQRRDIARRFVERDRNWSSNISNYIPFYQKLTGKTL
jgi:PEP-CTERM/exosortase A-associated glycosyltransferase